MAKTSEEFTPHRSMLRALESIALTRGSVERANGAFTTSQSYALYEKIMADLEVTSKEMQALLLYTSVRA